MTIPSLCAIVVTACPVDLAEYLNFHCTLTRHLKSTCIYTLGATYSFAHLLSIHLLLMKRMVRRGCWRDLGEMGRRKSHPLSVPWSFFVTLSSPSSRDFVIKLRTLYLLRTSRLLAIALHTLIRFYKFLYLSTHGLTSPYDCILLAGLHDTYLDFFSFMHTLLLMF